MGPKNVDDACLCFMIWEWESAICCLLSRMPKQLLPLFIKTNRNKWSTTAIWTWMKTVGIYKTLWQAGIDHKKSTYVAFGLKQMWEKIVYWFFLICTIFRKKMLWLFISITIMLMNKHQASPLKRGYYRFVILNGYRWLWNPDQSQVHRQFAQHTYDTDTAWMVCWGAENYSREMQEKKKGCTAT